MGEIQKQRDSEIVLLRLIGMLMIIGCHLSTYFGIGALGQILNVGVQLFLFISGWIYSNYPIADGKQWITKRWARICVPMYIWVAFVYVLEIGIKKSSGSLWGLLFSRGCLWIKKNHRADSTSNVIVCNIGLCECSIGTEVR